LTSAGTISLVVIGLATLLSGPAGAGDAPPTFAQYPATLQAGIRRVPPDLASHPQARRFRTVLREGARKGANFAGHYALVSWGCGTGCLRFALVDLATGQVRFPDRIESVFAPMPPGEGEPRSPLHFRRDSRLLEIEGYVGEAEGHFSYLLDGGELRLLCQVPKGGRACTGAPQ